MAEIAPRRQVVLDSGSFWRALPPCAQFSLRVDLELAATRLAGVMPLSTTACRAGSQGDWSALWLGPDEQLLIGRELAGVGFEATVAGALQGVAHSLVDVSHRQSAIEVTGPYAAALINAGCPLDLGLAAMPVGFCSRTVFAKAEIVLWRRTEICFQLQVWRSFLPYVTGILTLVAEEYRG